MTSVAFPSSKMSFTATVADTSSSRFTTAWPIAPRPPVIRTRLPLRQSFENASMVFCSWRRFAPAFSLAGCRAREIISQSRGRAHPYVAHVGAPFIATTNGFHLNFLSIFDEFCYILLGPMVLLPAEFKHWSNN